MIFESWIAVMITIGVFLLALVSIVGWIIEGERLSKERKENKKLLYENKKLSTKLSHRIALDNIKAASIR